MFIYAKSKSPMKKNEKKKKPQNCESCQFYDYDDESGCYICTVDLDEDEIFVRSYRETSAAVNRMLRKIPGLADKEKASYELRKMCVDHAYHAWGVEMAAAISGDDIKTLTYFYADVSHVKASPALVAGQV